MKILLADDDRVLTHLLSTRLRAKGAETIVAHDAMQAFMVAVKTSPDVIVLDVQMPGGTGAAALTRLKQSAKTSMIPVVVLTGSVDPKAAASFKALGAIEFLCKPVDPEELYRVVCAVLAPQEPVG
jgi:DNA-binding response OmpR family regulator